jgi:hypothetical protein
MATVSGWGTTKSAATTTPDSLLAVDVPIISLTVAQKDYPQETITSDQLAAGVVDTGGKDACQGDSGGPLVVKTPGGGVKLAGSVSWGYGCADGAHPGMYGRISSFAEWIKTTMANGGNDILTNGQAIAVSGAAGDWKHFQIEVPEGTADFEIELSGGKGDADLYVRAGAPADLTTFDCRPNKAGNSESCAFTSPKPNRYYISVLGHASFSNVRLVARVKASVESDTKELEDGTPVENLAADQGESILFTMQVPEGAHVLQFAISGGKGDADLYVRFARPPTSIAFDCRPFRKGNKETCTFADPPAGTYYVALRGHTAFSNLSLTGNYQ